MNLLKPNEGRAKLAIQFIIVVMIFDLVSLFSNILEYQLLSSEVISPDIANESDARQQIIAIVHLIVIIISAVTFIQWFRRAYYNLGERIGSLDNSEYWASLGWFVPFISLNRPYHIAKEIFSETEEYLEKNLANYKETTSDSKIGIWWTFWIVSNIIGNIAFRISIDADTLESLKIANIFGCLSDISSIPAGIFAILVIKEYAKIETLFYETERKVEVLETTISYETIEEKKADL